MKRYQSVTQHRFIVYFFQSNRPFSGPENRMSISFDHQETPLNFCITNTVPQNVAQNEPQNVAQTVANNRQVKRHFADSLLRSLKRLCF